MNQNNENATERKKNRIYERVSNGMDTGPAEKLSKTTMQIIDDRLEEKKAEQRVAARQRLTPMNIEAIRGLRAKGATIDQIHGATGFARSAIHHYVRNVRRESEDTEGEGYKIYPVESSELSQPNEPTEIAENPEGQRWGITPPLIPESTQVKIIALAHYERVSVDVWIEQTVLPRLRAIKNLEETIPHDIGNFDDLMANVRSLIEAGMEFRKRLIHARRQAIEQLRLEKEALGLP